MGHKKDVCPLCGKLKDTRSKRCKHKHQTKEQRNKRLKKWRGETKEKRREISRRFAAKRREWVSAYKAAKGCEICQEKDQRCLDFHHRNPKLKIKSVAQMVTHSMEAIMKEIEKCDLICANCHRKMGRKH